MTFQPSSLSPWKYQSEPMSATMRPYVFIASATTFPGPLKLDASKLDCRRRRSPIGGSELPNWDEPAKWVAGST